MGRKLTYEEVRNYIESYEYEMLNKEYKNNSTKLKIKRLLGHEFEMSFSVFR